jgi:2,3-bisphosphoglycerate-independent phosphoglycerate mutase
MAKKKNVVFLLIDGLADLPIEEKTPLSDALKPNLDWLAKNGVTGQILPLEKSFWNELARASISHLASISLLGYNPKKFNIKRGPLEAVGADIPYKEGYLALRCNFATVDKDLTMIDRRAGRNVYGLVEISRYINEHVDIGIPYIFKRTYGHRAALVIKMNLSDKIEGNDPLKVGEKIKKISALSQDALVSAKIVQTFVDKAREVMEYHPANAERIKRGIEPANYLVVREPGNQLIDLLPHFTKKHRLKNAVCIAEPGITKAVCMLAGFDAVTVPEFVVDGKIDLDKTMDFIFDNIWDVLPEYDFVCAHIKNPDVAAHDGDFKKKREAIEAIDKKLESFKSFDGILVVTCDHITSCETKKHEYGYVPLLVYGRGKDKSKRFDEFETKKGKLKNYNGAKLWKYVFGRK